MPKSLILLLIACLTSQLSYGHNLADKYEIYPSKGEKKFFINLHCSPVGMFYTFFSVLGALKEYERGKFSGVHVNFGSAGHLGTYYEASKGQNWWEYYFEPIYAGSDEGSHILTTVNGPQGQDFAMLIEFHTLRKEAFQLIKKHIKIKQHVKEIVNEFINSHFQNYTVIGVHYRGTDKECEAPRAAYEDMLAPIEEAKMILNTEDFLVFVATDEKAFLAYMMEQYPDRVIYYDSIRSSGNSAVHATSRHKYKKGEDALVDCLLLSRCDYMIKTSSNLSLAAAYFNPKMPMVHVTTRPWRKPLE